jgi:hypothetical protein
MTVSRSQQAVGQASKAKEADAEWCGCNQEVSDEEEMMEGSEVEGANCVMTRFEAGVPSLRESLSRVYTPTIFFGRSQYQLKKAQKSLNLGNLITDRAVIPEQVREEYPERHKQQSRKCTRTSDHSNGQDTLFVEV